MCGHTLDSGDHLVVTIDSMQMHRVVQKCSGERS